MALEVKAEWPFKLFYHTFLLIHNGKEAESKLWKTKFYIKSFCERKLKFYKKKLTREITFVQIKQNVSLVLIRAHWILRSIQFKSSIRINFLNRKIFINEKCSYSWLFFRKKLFSKFYNLWAMWVTLCPTKNRLQFLMGFI